MIPEEGSPTNASKEVLSLPPTAAFRDKVAPVGGECPQGMSPGNVPPSPMGQQQQRGPCVPPTPPGPTEQGCGWKGPDGILG